MFHIFREHCKPQIILATKQKGIIIHIVLCYQSENWSKLWFRISFQSFLASKVGDGNQEDFKSAKMFNSYRLKSQERVTPLLGSSS